jgi:hypothetical protein
LFCPCARGPLNVTASSAANAMLMILISRFAFIFFAFPDG